MALYEYEKLNSINLKDFWLYLNFKLNPSSTFNGLPKYVFFYAIFTNENLCIINDSYRRSYILWPLVSRKEINTKGKCLSIFNKIMSFLSEISTFSKFFSKHCCISHFLDRGTVNWFINAFSTFSTTYNDIQLLLKSIKIEYFGWLSTAYSDNNCNKRKMHCIHFHCSVHRTNAGNRQWFLWAQFILTTLLIFRALKLLLILYNFSESIVTFLIWCKREINYKLLLYYIHYINKYGTIWNMTHS